MRAGRALAGAATVLVALLGLAPSVHAQQAAQDPRQDFAQDLAQDLAQDVAQDVATDPDVDAAPGIQTLGEGESTIYVVDHGDSWSMHVESVPTDQLLGLWQQAGGPEMVAKTIVDRPYTLSVHRLSAERILERLFDGFDYTLHYDGSGRLVRVRVYSLDPAAVFKTPRLVESLREWTEKETPTMAEPEGEAAGSYAGDQ